MHIKNKVSKDWSSIYHPSPSQSSELSVLAAPVALRYHRQRRGVGEDQGLGQQSCVSQSSAAWWKIHNEGTPQGGFCSEPPSYLAEGLLLTWPPLDVCMEEGREDEPSVSVLSRTPIPIIFHSSLTRNGSLALGAHGVLATGPPGKSPAVKYF